jgi:magnesium transporter
MAPHERPVLARQPHLRWLVLRTAIYSDALERVSLGELSVLLGDRFVITIRHGQASPLQGLRHELEADPDRLQLGPAAVFAEIVNQVVDDYRPALDGFERDAVEVETQVFEQLRDRPVKRLYLLKRQVRELGIAIEALHEPLARLIRENGPCRSVRDELQQALDQLDRTVQRTHSLSDLLTSALDANMAQVSMQQNEDMRKISAWVAIAAVPTMVAGLYGMNFEHMPELGWRLGYPLVLGIIITACVLLHRQFRRAGWL